MAGEKGFLDYAGKEDSPSAFIQWKNTYACFDFYCLCGAHCHFDGYFAYFVKCPHCSQCWQMPSNLFPRPASLDDSERPVLMERDEDEDEADVLELSPIRAQITHHKAP